MLPTRPTLLLLLLGLALGGCASAPDDTLKPRGQAAVVLDVAAQRTEQTVTFADLVTLQLPPAAPGTGQTVAFLAIRSGTTRLRFVLVPDTGDRVADPVATHDVVLTIN